MDLVGGLGFYLDELGMYVILYWLLIGVFLDK